MSNDKSEYSNGPNLQLILEELALWVKLNTNSNGNISIVLPDVALDVFTSQMFHMVSKEAAKFHRAYPTSIYTSPGGIIQLHKESQVKINVTL